MKRVRMVRRAYRSPSSGGRACLLLTFAVFVASMVICFRLLSIRNPTEQIPEEPTTSSLHTMQASVDVIATTDEATNRRAIAEFSERLQHPATFYILTHPGGDAPGLKPSLDLFLDLRKLPQDVREHTCVSHAPLPLTIVLVRALDHLRGSSPKDFAQFQPALRTVIETMAANHMPTTSILRWIRGIDLGSNALASVTEDLLTLSDTLETLFLTDNLLTRVPEILASLPRLSRLSLKANRLTTIHPVRDLPTSLMHLIATENAIETFESGFYNDNPSTAASVQFSNLRKLMLAGNMISQLEAAFRPPSPLLLDVRSVYDSLELLRVSRNRISSLAASSKVLAAFQRLSWVSFAGNPVTSGGVVRDGSVVGGDDVLHGGVAALLDNTRQSMKDLTERVECSSAHPQVTVLGQGASGIVKQCMLYETISKIGEPQLIAVKFFKRISSDGSGADEIAALSRVPAHPNIVAPIGFIKFASMKQLVEAAVLEHSLSTQMHRFVGASKEEANDDGPVVAVCFPMVRSAPLGKPPTIWTVSDDIYESGGILSELWPFSTNGGPIAAPSAEQVVVSMDYAVNALLGALKAVRDILSAVAALHAPHVRLVHGDIYAHNMFFGPAQEGGGSSEPTPLTKAFHAALAAINRSRSPQQEPDVPRFPSNTFWAQNGILLTDFGASFHYSPDAFDEPSAAALVANELNAVRVFVRDLYESIIPVSLLTRHIANSASNVEVPDVVAHPTSSSTPSYPMRNEVVGLQLDRLLHAATSVANRYTSNVDGGQLPRLRCSHRRLVSTIGGTQRVLSFVFGIANQQVLNSDVGATLASVERVMEAAFVDVINTHAESVLCD